MRDNPAADWRIRDVERACAEANAWCSPPKGGGSHFKIKHPRQRAILTIPARRPIKPVYIRKLVAYLSDPGAIDA